MAATYEVKQIIVDLAAAFPDWKPSNMAGTLKQYEEALMGFPADMLRRAADRCRDSCIFFPKIAEIRKAIGEIQAVERPNIQGADESWKDKPWVLTPEMQKRWDDFRQHMVDTGKWKEARRTKPARTV
jgi:hypothetical protein